MEEEELPEDYHEELLNMFATKGWQYFIEYNVEPNMEACRDKALTLKDPYDMGNNRGIYDVWSILYNMREMFRHDIEENNG